MNGRADSDGTASRDVRKDYWGVVLDTSDAQALAAFYAALLDWKVIGSDPGFATVGPPDGVAYLACQFSEGYRKPVWPNADGSQQMMLHLDFEVVDIEVAVAHAVALGAELAPFQPQTNVRVMLDPAGHPFCLYTD